MNYLAHAYLSFGYPEILVGNIISDFVKGKTKFQYSKNIQNGIALHRLIDNFTDAHAATHQAKKVFKSAVGLYSGAFVDIVYDHFLANDTNELPANKWVEFSQTAYQSLSNYQTIFPERFAKMFPYMKHQNWLYNYRFAWGIENSFRGLVHRAAYLQSSAEAFNLFQKEYEILQDCYNHFFSDVKNYAFNQLQQFLQ
ncbi:MAG: ACP phosphodiesterase [Chitinophagaceae bacterium]